MCITTRQGDTDWTSKDIASACGVVPQAATRKLRGFEDRLAGILAAARAANPRTRPCDLASAIAAVITTGAQLAAYDRPRLERRLRQLAGLHREREGTSDDTMDRRAGGVAG